MMKGKFEYLMQLADQVLQDDQVKILDTKKGSIQESYNGAAAALGVTIALSGLRPAMAIYYQDKPNSKSPRKVNRRALLEAVARIISKFDEEAYHFIPQEHEEASAARKMMDYLLSPECNLKQMKKDIMDASVALKQIIRTYNLVKDE